MDDPILAAYLRDFSKSFNLENLQEPALFEYFTAYSVLFRDFSDNVSIEDLVVSGSHDTGIDSVGIFLNDIHVIASSQVDEITSRHRVDVDYAFVQSKTSKNLNAAEIASFIQGVREFFSKKYMPANEEIQERRAVSDYVFAQSVKMRDRPILHLYYCYAGRDKSDSNITARIEAGKTDLEALNLFSCVEFYILDAAKLQDRYQEVNLRIEKEIQINEYASLPPISGIRQAYIGVLPCTELVKLLSNSDGKLQKSLFNENVRDFLSRNPVNAEIAETLSSGALQSRLPALNNGITIVAKDIRIIGKKFTLSDFQIVNGCQTSHIIFENRGKLLPETSITVKIVEAEDKEIVNDIVRATNRQTEVKDEAFVVLGEFHKRLEKFFWSIEADPRYKLVYERRKRQYSDSAFTAQNIVTLTFLTNSFVSCCLDNPVDAVDYYGVLIKRYADKIFVDGQSFWP